VDGGDKRTDGEKKGRNYGRRKDSAENVGLKM